MRPNLVHQFLEQSADRRPDSICLVDGERRATFAAVNEQSCRLAGAFLERGLSPGDRVGLLAKNSLFFVECYYAIQRAGGIVVPLNTDTDSTFFGFCVRDADMKFLVLGDGVNGKNQRLLNELPLETALLTQGTPDLPALPEKQEIEDLLAVAEGANPAADVPVEDQNTACIIYTSGSTGRPRGVVLSHRNCVSNTHSVLAYLSLTPDDRVLAVLPFYYIYGKSVLDTHVAAGAAVVIENDFLFPHVALDRMERERCTGFSGVPSSFAILLNRSNLAKRKLPHLRYVTQAGGAMSPALTQRLIEALPNQDIYIMYGATEASGRLSYLPPEDLKANVGTIGKPIDNVELRILRPDGRECEVGETGELVARGPGIMQGYWNDPAATAQVLDEHGYHTGDLARREQNGYITIVGRSTDMIKVGAHRVSAKEIEEAIMEFSGVHEVAVIGLPDEILGEAIHAHIVPATGDFNVDALKRFLGRRLAPYKIPSATVLTDHLPRNGSGKIMKEKLRNDVLPD